MIHAETCVGSLAIILAILSGIAALGPIRHAANLRLIQAVRNRFGELPARAFMALVATLLLVAGVMILRDLRPQFAVPLTGTSGADYDAGNR